MRLIKINGKDSVKCVECNKWFPLCEKRIAVCTECRANRPVVPEPETRTPNIDLFRNMNAEYIESLGLARRERNRNANHNRKARELAVESTFTIEDWSSCQTAFGNTCAYCGKTGKLTQDHFVPVSKGGPYTLRNIIPACSFCNYSKHDDDFEFWYRRQPFYCTDRERKIREYLDKAPF